MTSHTMSPTTAPFIPFKLTTDSATDKSPPTSSPAQPQQLSATTLRPHYTRAVRAFLHRDIVLTHTLLTSAFALITPPLTSSPDSLAERRRKWDVLRITLDVTVYTAPPPTQLASPPRSGLTHYSRLPLSLHPSTPAPFASSHPRTALPPLIPHSCPPRSSLPSLSPVQRSAVLPQAVELLRSG